MSIEPNTWIRKERRTRRFAAGAACWSFAMLLLPLLVILPTHTHWHNTVGNDVGISLFVVVLAAAGFWMARRLGTAGLWLADDRIVVKGPLKTWLLSPADVERFVPGVWGGGNGPLSVNVT